VVPSVVASVVSVVTSVTAVVVISGVTLVDD